jgi:homospermidine synthase
LFRHLAINPAQVEIIAADKDGNAIARRFDLGVRLERVTKENYLSVLESRLREGDFLLNLSIGISSLALIELCRRRGALYLDTCIEPWAGEHTDPVVPVSLRSNYALREEVLAFRRNHGKGPTAIVAQGANPGLVSAFIKQALLDIAAGNGIAVARPARREAWAALAQRLNIRTIHIAERDTQNATQRKKQGEFVNTWSIPGFIGESLQPAELGWGCHERHWPADGLRHSFGCGAAIYLNRAGAATRVRSWTPLEGAYQGFLITHLESISIADHLTLKKDGETIYRPTVHYAYCPCDDALLSLHEMAGKNWRPQSCGRIIRDEIEEGVDELGVLLMGNTKGAYWYGSRLSIRHARRLAPHNNATTLQVAAGVLAGIVWALRNPRAGIVEPDDIDDEVVMDIARPYLGEVVGIYSDWNPLHGRSQLFSEEIDRDDPWQFKNFRVS